MSQVRTKTPGLKRYRITVAQFDMMIQAGVLGGARVELLGGVMVVVMTKNDPHDYAVSTLGDLFREVLPRSEWYVREEKSLRLGRSSRPEPDVTVVRGCRTDFVQRGPTGHETALVIEVADSSYAKDAGVKLRLYERCGIPAYWVVDLPRRQVEVYTLDRGAYGAAVIYKEADEVRVALDGREYGRVPVVALLA